MLTPSYTEGTGGGALSAVGRTTGVAGWEGKTTVFEGPGWAESSRLVPTAKAADVVKIKKIVAFFTKSP